MPFNCSPSRAVMPAPGALTLLAAASLALLAGCGEGQSASASQVVAGCPSAWLAGEVGAGNSVELLVAAGPTIPGGRWAAYRTMAAAVAGCAGPGTQSISWPPARPLTITPPFAACCLLPADASKPGHPLRHRNPPL